MSESGNPQDLTYLGDLWRLDLETDSWEYIPTVPTVEEGDVCGRCPERAAGRDHGPGFCPGARAYGSMVSVSGGRPLLFGGQGHDCRRLGDLCARRSIPLNDVWIFEVESGHWERVMKHARGEERTDAPFGRSGAALWYVEEVDAVFAYGWYSGGFGTHDAVWRLDLGAEAAPRWHAFPEVVGNYDASHFESGSRMPIGVWSKTSPESLDIELMMVQLSTGSHLPMLRTFSIGRESWASELSLQSFCDDPRDHHAAVRRCLCDAVRGRSLPGSWNHFEGTTNGCIEIVQEGSPRLRWIQFAADNMSITDVDVNDKPRKRPEDDDGLLKDCPRCLVCPRHEPCKPCKRCDRKKPYGCVPCPPQKPPPSCPDPTPCVISPPPKPTTTDMDEDDTDTTLSTTVMLVIAVCWAVAATVIAAVATVFALKGGAKKASERDLSYKRDPPPPMKLTQSPPALAAKGKRTPSRRKGHRQPETSPNKTFKSGIRQRGSRGTGRTRQVSHSSSSRYSEVLPGFQKIKKVGGSKARRKEGRSGRGKGRGVARSGAGAGSTTKQSVRQKTSNEPGSVRSQAHSTGAQLGTAGTGRGRDSRKPKMVIDSMQGDPHPGPRRAAKTVSSSDYSPPEPASAGETGPGRKQQQDEQHTEPIPDRKRQQQEGHDEAQRKKES